MKFNRKKRSLFYVIPFLVLFCVVSFTTSKAFARYLYSFTGTDSAMVAKFDFEIIPPAEFVSVSSDDPYIYSFSGSEETKSLSFKIINHKEIDVICTPSIDSNVQYEIFVLDTACENFIVRAGEEVEFQVVVLAEGLSEEAIVATLLLDIEQL